MAKAEEFSVKVSGLQISGISSNEAREIFEDQGFETITDVYLPARKDFGFVRFSSEVEAQAAADMKVMAIRGLELRLELSTGDKKGKGKGAGKEISSVFDYQGGRSAGSHGPSFDVTRHRAHPTPAAQPASAGKGAGKSEHSVWVGNLPDGITSEDLKEMFRERGMDTMTDVFIPSGKPFGFVRFGSFDEVEEALRQCEGLAVGDIELELKASSTQKRSSSSAAPMLSAGPPGGGYGPAPGTYSPGGYGPGGYGPGGYGPGASYGYMDGGYFEGSGGYGKGCAGYVGSYGSDSGHGPPSRKIRGEHSVWVGNLPENVSPDELQRAFEDRGVTTMTDVYIPPGKGFGFIRFSTRDEVEEAVHSCEGLCLGGMELELKSSTTEKRGPAVGPTGRYGRMDDAHAHAGYGQLAEVGPQMSTSGKGKDKALQVSVKVGNLTPGTTSEEVREAFEQNGVDTMTDVYVPTGRNYGFLRFGRLSEARNALQCDGMEIGGSEIVLELAEGNKKSSQEIVAMESGKKGGKGPIAYHHNEAGFDTAFVGRSGDGEVSVRLGNLPSDVSPEEVCEAFAAQGVDSMTDCYIPQGRKFGFLRFASAAEGKHALACSVSIRGQSLELQFSTNKKRNSEEMAGAREEQVRHTRPAGREAAGRPPVNPDVSQDAPSVKVNGLPPGVSSDELHQAVMDAGCGGGITDVYIPKGDRGFGFVRFSKMREAEATAGLEVNVRGTMVELEISVGQRKGKRETASHPYGMDAGCGGGYGQYGPEAAYGYPPNGGHGHGPGMAYRGGYGSAKGFGGGYGGGPYGGKGPKGYW